MDAAAARRAVDTRAAVWARHWASGSPHSCAGSYGPTYGGAVAAFWAEVLREVPAGARVLDLATGAAALPRLFLQLAPGKDLSIDAVDLAHAAPAWLSEPAAGRVRFHGGVSIEALPWADQSVDLVVSQYGLEYAGQSAWTEARRVRAPESQVALVLHHAESRPVRLAATELAHIDWLLAPGGLLPAARTMAGPLSRAATAEGRAALATDREALACREAFNRAQAALAARAAQAPDGADVLLETRDAVARALGLARERGDAVAAQAALSALEAGLSDAHWRLRELQACALDEQGVEALTAALANPGESRRIGPLHEGPHLMGWAVRIAAR